MLINIISASHRRRDPDAAAYISAVETAKGSAMTTTQSNAIKAFILAEKSAGRWSSIKRLYFPVWANAGANGIDMITRTSGTWNGTMTHAAGYAQGNGSSGYLDMGVSPVTLGLTTGSAMTGAVVYVAASVASAQIISCGTTNRLAMDQEGASPAGAYFTLGSAGGYLYRTGAANGVMIGGRISGTRYLGWRTTGGGWAATTRTDGDSGALATSNIYAWARNTADTPGSSPNYYSNHKLGAVWVGTGMDSTAASALSATMKTLWETTSGLTLP